MGLVIVISHIAKNCPPNLFGEDDFDLKFADEPRKSLGTFARSFIQESHRVIIGGGSREFSLRALPCTSLGRPDFYGRLLAHLLW